MIAPAWSHWGTVDKVGRSTLVLHSEHDDVVAIDDSRELLRRSGLTDEQLIVVGENHRMVDDEAFEALVASIERAGRDGQRADDR